MPEEVRYQATIFEIAGRLIQWAQVWLRRFMMTGDINALSRALLCMRFPFKHGSVLEPWITREVILAQGHIAAYYLTKNPRYLHLALEELARAERMFWEAARKPLYKTLPPQEGDITFEPFTFWTQLDLYLRQNEEEFFIELFLLFIGGSLLRSVKFLSSPAVRQYLPETVAAVWKEIEGPLLRKFPQVYRKVRVLMRRLISGEWEFPRPIR